MADFLPTLAVVLALTWVAFRYLRPQASDERPLLWMSFVAHQVAGIANILVLKYFYGYGDMLTYHSDGMLIADRLRSDFWGLAPGLVGLIFHRQDPLPIPLELLAVSSGSMQGIAGFAAYFLFDSLYATCALIAGAAFLSKIALYRLAREELPELPRRALLWSCTLVPSVVFWSSSLLKEPIAMIGLLWALYGWHQLVNGRARSRSILLILASCTLIFLVKSYILPVFGTSCAIWYLARRFQARSQDVVFRLGHVLLAGAAAAAIIAIIGTLLPTFAPSTLREQLAGNQAAGATLEAGSNYSLGASSGSAAGQLALAPMALLTALFRPMLFEARNPLVLANALEMTAFLLATLWVPFRRGVPEAFSDLFRRPFLSFCATFVVMFGTFTGLGSTNLGTLSRYRAPLVPFFATLLFALLAKEQRAQSLRALPRQAARAPGNLATPHLASREHTS